MSHHSQSNPPYSPRGYGGGPQHLQPSYQSSPGHRPAGVAAVSHSGNASTPTYASQQHHGGRWPNEQNQNLYHSQHGGSSSRRFRGNSSHAPRFNPHPHPYPPPPAPAAHPGLYAPVAPPHVPPPEHTPYNPIPPPHHHWPQIPPPFGAGAVYYPPGYGQYPPPPPIPHPSHHYGASIQGSPANREQYSHHSQHGHHTQRNQHNQRLHWEAAHGHDQHDRHDLPDRQDRQDRPARPRFPTSRQWKRPGLNQRSSAQGAQESASNPTASAASPHADGSPTTTNPPEEHHVSTPQRRESNSRDPRRESYNETESYDFEHYYSDNGEVDPNLSLGEYAWKPARKVNRAIPSLPSDFKEGELEETALKPSETARDGVSTFAKAGEQEQTRPVEQRADWHERKDDPAFANLAKDTSTIPRDDVVAGRRAPALQHPTWNADGDHEEGELKETNVLEERKPSLYVKSKEKSKTEDKEESLEIENLDDEDDVYSPPPATTPPPRNTPPRRMSSSDEYEPSANTVPVADEDKVEPSIVDTVEQATSPNVVNTIEESPAPGITNAPDKPSTPVTLTDAVPKDSHRASQEKDAKQVESLEASGAQKRPSSSSDQGSQKRAKTQHDSQSRRSSSGYEPSLGRGSSSLAPQAERPSPHGQTLSRPHTPASRVGSERPISRPGSAQSSRGWRGPAHQETRSTALGVGSAPPSVAQQGHYSPYGSQQRRGSYESQERSSPHGPPARRSSYGSQSRRDSSDSNFNYYRHGQSRHPRIPPPPPPPPPPPEEEKPSTAFAEYAIQHGDKPKSPSANTQHGSQDGEEVDNAMDKSWEAPDDAEVQERDTEAATTQAGSKGRKRKRGGAEEQQPEQKSQSAEEQQPEQKARTPTPPNIGRSSLRSSAKPRAPTLEEEDGIKRQKIDTPRSKKREPHVDPAFKRRW